MIRVKQDAGQGGQAPQATAAAACSGLVPYKTSVGEGEGEGFDGFLELDPKEIRLKRMRQGVVTSARLISEDLAKRGGKYQAWMLTPTYRPGEVWEPYHITGLVKSIREYFKVQGISLPYVWVSEIQDKRLAAGAPVSECVHYHICIWLPAGVRLPQADREGWWSHGLTRTEKVVAPIRYMMKYASKGGSEGSSVAFPKGLRLHGFGGLSAPARNERTWWMSPRWVRQIWSIYDVPRRVPGGGWLSRVTGEWLPSLWQVLVNQGAVFCRVRDDIRELWPADYIEKVGLADYFAVPV